jgi:hypothetical protein
MRLLFLLTAILASALSVGAAEQDALAISANIQRLHTPYGNLLDPVFASPESNEVVSYTRCGDSAIWTGHYLAAEAFRYATTRSGDALANARRAVRGLRALVEVTGTNLLSRCAIPADSPHAAAITAEESHNGVHQGTLDGKPYLWIGNTSRDQYSGAFFGLAVAYELVDNPELRSDSAALVTRLLDFLITNNWQVTMPDGSMSTVFWGRNDQQLAFLAIGAQLNADRFRSKYRWARLFGAGEVVVPVWVETFDDNHSYFKFNLDTINLYGLIRLEHSDYYLWWYRQAYEALRGTTRMHQNAHFNMIDRALNGPDDARDAETRALLEAWLQRPRRDAAVDWRGVLASCGDPDRACAPIPVQDRVRTDFLWQRSPFLMHGGDVGKIETAGVDYILPYWMARYYGVVDR